MQVPLALGYAMTVAKAQSFTLDRVEASLTSDEMFFPGYAFVVLSRVREPSHLFLTSYDPDCIRCNSVVYRFFEE